jgi:hypothetical protein
MDESEFVSFTIGIAGAIIGSVSSLIFTYYYDNFRKSQTVVEIVSSNKEFLLQELKYDLEEIIEKENIIDFFLLDSVHNSLVTSGNFVHFPKEIQKQLELTYSLVKRYNEFVSSAFLTPPSQRDEIHNIIKSLKGTLRGQVTESQQILERYDVKALSFWQKIRHDLKPKKNKF